MAGRILENLCSLYVLCSHDDGDFTIPMPRILRWLVEFRKICVVCTCCVHMLMVIYRKFYPSDLSFLPLQILWKIIVIDFFWCVA